MLPKEVIIIGGGPSIQEGLSLGLKDKIKDKFVITCNASCYHFDSTLTTCMDIKFYNGRLDGIDKPIRPEHVDKLKSLPLIISAYRDEIKEINYGNTILVRESNIYSNNPLKNGFYAHCLTGIFSLSIVSWLINYDGVIYLMGFDWTKRTQEEIKNKQSATTHYYEDIKHKGIGITKRYEDNNPNIKFDPFLKEHKLKIYNIGLDSNIACFEKVNYEEMFELIDKEKYNQEEIRKEIKLIMSTNS